MSASQPKKLAFEQFAAVGRALGSGHRLELLDVLVQGERSVEALAQASGLLINNASQHLQQLRRAGLVTSRKAGKQVIYALAGVEVIALVKALRQIAEQNLAEIGQLIDRYYRRRDSLEPVSRDELMTRIRKRSVIVIDVRPAEEFAAGHVPGAISMPVADLKRRLKEFPKGREIVAYCRGPYCVFSYDAIDVLRPKGFDVRRLDGGFLEWLAAGFPIEHPSAPVARTRRRKLTELAAS